jgi:hypothetical protein
MEGLVGIVQAATMGATLPSIATAAITSKRPSSTTPKKASKTLAGVVFNATPPGVIKQFV